MLCVLVLYSLSYYCYWLVVLFLLVYLVFTIVVRAVGVCYMLFVSLVSVCFFVTLTLYHLATITALYRLYCCLGVLLATYYDKAPLKGAYLLVRLIFRVGIIIYLSLAWLVYTKKDNGNYIRYPLIIYWFEMNIFGILIQLKCINLLN